MNSLGFDKAPADTRVVVAMSGGVDSSVTAALLRAEGYDVVGVTLQLYDHGAATARKGACCAGQDIHDARTVAAGLDIPHFVFDYESRFREAVIDDFLDSYLAGETPIPCVRCNQTVKFRDLLQAARELGADCLATGHYVRRVATPYGPQLHTATDGRRDQSYFLFATTPPQLDFLRFPLGDRPKDEVRSLAERHGLLVAAKPDSQDICFVPQGSYASVVRKLRPEAQAAGDLVDLDGRVIGRHDGTYRFTVGQRRGIGVGGAGEPLYVVAVDAERRRVVVGPKRALARDRVDLQDCNWLTDESEPLVERRVAVKLRSAQPAAAARLTADDDGTAQLRLDVPQFGVARGQAAVVYDGSRVLGGGWIAATALSSADQAAA